jgi:hypothetical protein
MMPNGLSDSFAHGSKLTTSITFLSSGIVTSTPIKALITDLYPIVSTESAMSGVIDVEQIKDIIIRIDVENMAGVTSIEEITLESFGLIEYVETEETMIGVTSIEEITLTTT